MSLYEVNNMSEQTPQRKVWHIAFFLWAKPFASVSDYTNLMVNVCTCTLIWFGLIWNCLIFPHFTYLQEEYERYPLVISLVCDIIILGIIVTNSYLSRVMANLGVPMFGNGEGGQDIAISVDDVLRYGPRVNGSFHDARDLGSVAYPF